MTDLKISLSEEKTTDFTVVNVSGIIDARTNHELETVLNGLISSNCRGILINLATVEYISTGGWSTLVSAAEAIRKTEREIYLTNMIPNVLENYHFLEFDRIIESFDNINDAQRAIQRRTQKESD